MKNTFFDNYFSELILIYKKINYQILEKIINKILKISKKKGCIYIFGNGGSASTANHISVDFTKNAKIKSRSISSSNLITCYANDYGYEKFISKYIDQYVLKNDLVIFLSVSGESKNLISAAKLCNRKKIYSISITGMKEKNTLSKITNISMHVNSFGYNIVEITHFTILASIVDSIIGKVIYKSNR